VPLPTKLTSEQVPVSTRLYDRNGKLIKKYKCFIPKRDFLKFDNVIIETNLDKKGSLKIGGKYRATFTIYPYAKVKIKIAGRIIRAVNILNKDGNWIRKEYALVYKNGSLVDSFYEITQKSLFKYGKVTIKNVRLSKKYGNLTLGKRTSWAQFPEYRGKKVEVDIKDGVVTEVRILNRSGNIIDIKEFKLVYKDGKLIDSFYSITQRGLLKILQRFGKIMIEGRLYRDGLLSLGGGSKYRFTDYANLKFKEGHPNTKYRAYLEEGLNKAVITKVILLNDKDEPVEEKAFVLVYVNKKLAGSFYRRFDKERLFQLVQQGKVIMKRLQNLTLLLGKVVGFVNYPDIELEVHLIKGQDKPIIRAKNTAFFYRNLEFEI